MFIHVNNLESCKLFNEKFRKGKWLILYYAPWCYYCKLFMDDWNEFVKTNKKNINIAMINDEQITNIKPEQIIYGYPTVKFFLNKKKVIEFNKEKNLNNLNKFVSDNLSLKKKKTRTKKKVTNKTKRKKPTKK